MFFVQNRSRRVSDGDFARQQPRGRRFATNSCYARGSARGLAHYFSDRLLVGLPPEAAIAKEEFFGPVAMIFPFKTDDEAIHLANITDFGLSAAVWSRDLVRARRVADEIESGMVFINDFTRSDPRAPFGGFKASGYGRELGAPGALELTNPKLIWQGEGVRE